MASPMEQAFQAAVMSHDTGRLEAALAVATEQVVNESMDYPYVEVNGEMIHVNSKQHAMFRVLLACPLVDENAVTEYGESALHEAARSTDPVYMRDLLKRPGLHINLRDVDGWSALYACGFQRMSHDTSYRI